MSAAFDKVDLAPFIKKIDDEIHRLVQEATIRQAEATEQSLRDFLATMRKPLAIVVNPSQQFPDSDLYELKRSPFVPHGTAYIIDPNVLDFKGGLQ